MLKTIIAFFFFLDEIFYLYFRIETNVCLSLKLYHQLIGCNK